MFYKAQQYFWKVLVGLMLLMAVSIFSLSVVTNAQDDLKVLDIEVAENGLAFVFDESRVHDDGLPSYGSGFVTQGYIYPSGTLSGSNGVLETGEPEFPDLVIGIWTCYGYMIGDGAHTQSGAWVVSTQIFEFDETYDKSTVVTVGTEIADLNIVALRAITGGTNNFNGAQGQQSQTLLGLNPSQGVVLQINLDMD